MSFFSFKWLVNLFRSAANKAWASLSEDLQNHALTAASFAQVIKTNLGIAYKDFIVLAAVKTGLSEPQIESLLLVIAKDFGISTTKYEEIYSYVQGRAKAADTNNAWNSLWQNIQKFGATYLSSGKLDWVTLSLGVAQVAYEKLTKK